MSRPFLSTLAAAAVLLAAAPALADPAAPAVAAPVPVAATSAAQAAAPAASCDGMTKKVQDLEARLRASEAKVAQLMRDRIPTPPDSHAESY